MPGTTIHITAVLLGALLLVTGCQTLPPADPARSTQLQSEGMRLLLDKDYAAAAVLYGEATLYDPQNSAPYLWQADLLEATGRPEEALKAYRSALSRLPADDPVRDEIIFRAALLDAGPLDNPGRAQRSLKKLSSSTRQTVLLGALHLTEGDPRQALKSLDKARGMVAADDIDMIGRIHFYRALAQDALGADTYARDELFYAVNNAVSPALKVAISALFEEILSRPAKN